MFRLFIGCLLTLSFVQVQTRADSDYDPFGPTIVTEAEEPQESIRDIAEEIIKQSQSN